MADEASAQSDAQLCAKTAHHEAGHAVAAWSRKVGIEYMTLKDWVMREALTQLVERDYPTDRDVAEAWAIQYFAGGAAEKRFTGEASTGSHDDRRNAAEVITAFVSAAEERKALLATLEDQATRLVEDRWYLIEALAERMLELCEKSGDPFHQMAGDEISQFLSQRQTR